MAPSVGTCVIEMSSDNGLTFTAAPAHLGETEMETEERALTLAAATLRFNDFSIRARILRHGGEPIYLRRTVNGVIRYRQQVIET